MYLSDHGPMLGTHTADRWGAKRNYRRNDKPVNADMRRLQKRSARMFERELLALDLATEKAQDALDFMSEADQIKADASFEKWLDRHDLSRNQVRTGAYHADSEVDHWFSDDGVGYWS